ncbi:MAG: hypothetical protein AAGI01_17500 [Myxococcota bacterium]
MSTDETDHFQLNFNGIQLEISGERSFVQHMYREVMRDLEEARRRALQAKPSSGKKRVKSRERPEPNVIWLHRVSDMVHKIYMASHHDLDGSPLFDVLDRPTIGTLYVEDNLLPRALQRFARGQTLWAELTSVGRRKIAEATGKYNAVKVDANRSNG